MGERAPRLIFAWVCILSSVAGCSRTSPATDAGGALESPTPRRDAAGEAPSSQVERPPQEVMFTGAEPGDIAAEVREFNDLDLCKSQLGASVPPAIVEVLGDVGYQRVTTDACKTRLALASQESSICDQLAVRATRNGCRRRYAMYHGDPDGCPTESRHDGRDPTCVAVAMRDHSMCYAAESDDQIGICRSIILRDERPCRVAHENLVAARRCARTAKRWWNAMPPTSSKRRLPLGFEPTLTICRRGEPSADDGGPDANSGRCRANAGLVQRGIVLLEERTVLVGARKGLPIGPRNPVIELRFPPSEAELPVELDDSSGDVGIWIDLQAHPLHSTGHEAENVKIDLERFGTARGSIIRGTYEATLTDERGETLSLEGRFETFVRDTIASPEIPDAGPNLQ